MTLKNFSLTLLATATFGSGIFNTISAAATVVSPPPLVKSGSAVLLDRVANETHEIAALDAGATDALQKRLAAAKLKFDELTSAVQDKTATAKQASEALTATHTNVLVTLKQLMKN